MNPVHRADTVSVPEMAKVRSWLADVAPPSSRTMITAAVAGVSVIAGITVAVTLG